MTESCFEWRGYLIPRSMWKHWTTKIFGRCDLRGGWRPPKAIVCYADRQYSAGIDYVRTWLCPEYITAWPSYVVFRIPSLRRLDWSYCTLHLASALQNLFKRVGSMEDLNHAIELQNETFNFTIHDDPKRSAQKITQTVNSVLTFRANLLNYYTIQQRWSTWRWTGSADLCSWGIWHKLSCR